MQKTCKAFSFKIYHKTAVFKHFINTVHKNKVKNPNTVNENSPKTDKKRNSRKKSPKRLQNNHLFDSNSEKLFIFFIQITEFFQREKQQFFRNKKRRNQKNFFKSLEFQLKNFKQAKKPNKTGF